MQELAWHLMFRTDDDRVIAPSTAARRALARTVYELAGPCGLLAFGAADNHLHVVVVCSRELAGRLAQRLAVALRARLGIAVRFFPTRFREVRDQRHLRAVLHYVLGQRNHHGLGSDPFLDASSLPELLGMRLLRTDSVGLVRELLPRVTRGELQKHLGVATLELGPSLVQPVDAVAGALGLADLDVDRALGHLGRAAVVQLCGDEMPTRVLMELLNRGPRTISRLRGVEVPLRLMRAAQQQLALRQVLQREHPQVLEMRPTELPELRRAG